MRLLLAALLCAFLQAQPKPPQSSSGTNSKQNDNNTGNNQKHPGGPKPLTANPAPINQSLPAHTDEETEANRKIANYTEALARYTLALVVVGSLQFAALVVQGIFLYRAFRETQGATTLTRRSVEESIRSNAGNEGLTLASNEITREATELTQQSILLTHRPKLIVRSFYSDSIRAGPTVDGRFQIVNVGGTKARIAAMTPNYASKRVALRCGPQWGG
jgi:hypothetical protein